jgi:hypothetical protein
LTAGIANESATSTGWFLPGDAIWKPTVYWVLNSTREWRGVLSVLKQIGYDGWLTIESFAQPEPDLAAAAAIWRDLAPSGDELAKRGIRFIKRLAKELGAESGRKPVVRKQKVVGRKEKSTSRK